MSLNVLVVDDSLVVRKMIAKVLGLAGLPIGEILEAGNGADGLRLLDEHWVDLLIVDINMPVMTGEEMIECIRGSPITSDLPILVISTEGSETRVGRFLDRNTRFIHKPFTPEQVRDAVAAMLGVTHEH